MKNSLLLAVVALLLRAAAGAQIAEPRAASEVQAPAANLQFASLDKALDDLAFKLAELKNCVALHSALKANLAQKKRQFASENGGVVPFEFNELLNMKSARLGRIFASCRVINDSLPPLFETASLEAKSFEPPSAPGLVKRRERLATLYTLANSLLKRL